MWAKRLLQPKYIIVLLLAAIACQLGLIAYFQFNHYLTSAAMDSDAAAEILLAQHMFENGEFLVSRSWYYSTEIRVLHNHLVMQPLFFFTNDYRAVVAASAVIIAALIALAVYYCVRGTGVSCVQALLAAFVAIFPFGVGLNSDYYYAVFISNAYYAFFMVCSLLVLGLYLRTRRASGRKRAVYLAVMAVFTVLLGLSGMRYALILILPLLAAQALEIVLMDGAGNGILQKRELAAYAKRFAPALAPALGFAVGYLANLTWLQPLLGKATRAEQMQFITGGNRLGNTLNGLFASLLSWLGFYASGGAVFSLQGILNLVLLAFTLYVLVSAVCLLKKLRLLGGGLRFYVLFAWCAALLNCVVLCVVQDGFSNARYLCLGMFWLLPCPVLHSYTALRRARPGGLLAAALLVCTLAATNLQLVTVHYPYEAGSIQAYGAGYQYLESVSVGDRQGYIGFLRQNGYTLGAADFWDAGITTIYSEGELAMVNIHTGGPQYSYYHWLMPREYSDPDKTRPQFVVLASGMADERRAKDLETPGELVYYDEYFAVYDITGLDTREVIH